MLTAEVDWKAATGWVVVVIHNDVEVLRLPTLEAQGLAESMLSLVEDIDMTAAD